MANDIGPWSRVIGDNRQSIMRVYQGLGKKKSNSERFLW